MQPPRPFEPDIDDGHEMGGLIQKDDAHGVAAQRSIEHLPDLERQLAPTGTKLEVAGAIRKQSTGGDRVHVAPLQDAGDVHRHRAIGGGGGARGLGEGLGRLGCTRRDKPGGEQCEADTRTPHEGPTNLNLAARKTGHGDGSFAFETRSVGGLGSASLARGGGAGVGMLLFDIIEE